MITMTDSSTSRQGGLAGVYAAFAVGMAIGAMALRRD
jgi:hypothetical protein